MLSYHKPWYWSFSPATVCSILGEKSGVLRPPTLPSNLTCFSLYVASSLTSSLQKGSQVEWGEKENWQAN